MCSLPPIFRILDKVLRRPVEIAANSGHWNTQPSGGASVGTGFNLTTRTTLHQNQNTAPEKVHPQGCNATIHWHTVQTHV